MHAHACSHVRLLRLACSAAVLRACMHACMRLHGVRHSSSTLSDSRARVGDKAAASHAVGGALHKPLRWGIVADRKPGLLPLEGHVKRIGQDLDERAVDVLR
jgi:hypothetical protein